MHRDIRTRNLLVFKQDGRYSIKISDFGLSRSIDTFYTMSEKSRCPIKWTAPEVFKTNKYSIQSDVWSFGGLNTILEFHNNLFSHTLGDVFFWCRTTGRPVEQRLN